MPKSNILTAAQIGCGKFAWNQDLVNLTAHPDVNLKWVCDVNSDNARRAAEHFAVPRCTSDLQEVLDDPEVDFIKIATTHEVHLPIIEAAAKAGKHIFCEKPMAMVNEEAYRIIRAVRRAGVKLCVDLNRRMSPAMQSLRRKWLDHAANPQHNPWRYVETVREPLPEENLPHMVIRIQDESSSYGLGHLDPLSGGGEIIGESVHWLDLACWFFAPQLPCEITAWGSSRLSHGIHLRFDRGASMTLDFSCSGTFDFPKELYEVTDNAALFRSLHFVENNYYGMPKNAPEFFAPQHDPFPEKGQGFDAFQAKYLANVAGSTNAKLQENATPLMPDKGHRAMLDGFVRAIQEDLPSPCDELAGFRSTYLAQRAIESLELKRTLPIPLEKITPCIL
ncbi:MAG: Gfo/Idh/MocA family oxidoreductase [Victivallales bacterium]|nr:Gfo/Idh/MocA family oxidoreductase [Victivallales bacterium]